MIATALPDLQALPSTGPLFLKAAMSARRKPGKVPVIPANTVTLKGLRFDAAHLAAYNAVCQLPAYSLALTYPQVLAAPLHLHVMTQPNFPLPLLGVVHLRNRIEQHAPLARDAAYDVRVQIGDSRATHQGIEVELLTDYLLDGTPVWSAVTTVLHRIKSKQTGHRPSPPAASVASYVPFSVPADVGRRYAPIAQDYNPIHMTAVTARLFGFPRAIAHGMWSAARCLGILMPEFVRTPTLFELQFKQPLLLPARVTLKHQTAAGGIDFELLAREGGKTHFSGRLA